MLVAFESLMNRTPSILAGHLHRVLETVKPANRRRHRGAASRPRSRLTAVAATHVAQDVAPGTLHRIDRHQRRHVAVRAARRSRRRPR